MNDDRPSPGATGSDGTKPVRPRRRAGLVAVAAVVTMVVLGGGAIGVAHVLRGGASADKALPASSIAMLSVDLDPSAEQKIEAIKTLRKFPLFREKAEVSSSSDLRQKFFDQVVERGDCAGLSYADDVEPWIGDNAGVAAVSYRRGTISPVIALAVRDEHKARSGLRALVDCAGETRLSGFTVRDGFALISDSQADAERAAKESAVHPLADDEAYRSWTTKIGERGVVSFYVAKAAQAALSDLGGLGQDLGSNLTGVAGASAPYDSTARSAGFEGAAGTLRFADGGLELSSVIGSKGASKASREAGSMVTSMPSDTAAVLALSVPEGFARRILNEVEAYLGGVDGTPGSSPQLDKELGLGLPGDVEALLGRGVSVSLGGTPPADLHDVSQIPAAVEISGDTQKIGRTLDKVLPHLVYDPSDFPVVTFGDHVIASPSYDYAEALSAGGRLGTDPTFRRVVPQAARASSILFVDFDSPWRKTLATAWGGRDATEVIANTAPLQALGLASWVTDDESHLLLKVTTD